MLQPQNNYQIGYLNWMKQKRAESRRKGMIVAMIIGFIFFAALALISYQQSMNEVRPSSFVADSLVDILFGMVGLFVGLVFSIIFLLILLVLLFASAIFTITGIAITAASKKNGPVVIPPPPNPADFIIDLRFLIALQKSSSFFDGNEVQDEIVKLLAYHITSEEAAHTTVQKYRNLYQADLIATLSDLSPNLETKKKYVYLFIHYKASEPNKYVYMSK
jgi:hypothetical protein